MNLRVPGPTPLPPQTLSAAGRQMINHRGPEFASLLREVTERLRPFLGTNGDVLVLTGSGSGGLEAALVNTLSPGDHVLAVSTGIFGDRFADTAAAFGAEVTKVAVPWGEAADPALVRAALAADSRIAAVLVTHNETSTGVTNDLPGLAAVVRETEALLLVDAVSSAGAMPLEADAWGCDVVVCCSQKAFMAPPGLALVSVSERAWRAAANARMPRVYWDLATAKKTMAKGQTPWTPAVSVLYALAESLTALEAEGKTNVFARHRRVGERMRRHTRELGLSLLPRDPAYASNTTTAVRLPEGIDAGQLLRTLHDEFDVVLAGGQGQLSGKIFRVGHVGWVNENDVDDVAAALQVVLPRLGFRPAAEGPV
ncbi:MAG: pyridoxal-phosphate-dependent aminotransferase family protein [Chloroflexota bacterium]